jgi:hypothetical protein
MHAFGKDILAPKKFKPKTQVCSFCCQNIGPKCALKMLMKFTPGGTPCAVIGWGAIKYEAKGKKEHFTLPQYLQYLKMTVIDRNQCNISLHGDVRKHEICVGTNVLNKAICLVNHLIFYFNYFIVRSSIFTLIF